MEKLKKDKDGLFITKKVKFNKIASFTKETIEKVLNFAYDMSYGEEGAHRDHRSGGTYERSRGEIFSNAYQGKLAEYAFYHVAKKEGLDLEEPDLSVWELGKWDDFDIEVGGRHLNIKSTKFFGNLLLLETKDWNNDGEYIPNIGKDGKTTKYDYFILCRIKPFCEDVSSLKELLKNDTTEKEKLMDIIIGQDWEYDIPGWIMHDELLKIITDKYIIEKGEKLNGKTPMDAENYYVQSGDMKDIKQLINILKNIAIK